MIDNLARWIIFGLLTDRGLAPLLNIISRVADYEIARDSNNKLVIKIYDLYKNPIISIELTCYSNDCIETLNVLEKGIRK